MQSTHDDTIPGRLYWSEDGHIACRRHVPYPGSDTFIKDRWRLMSEREKSEFLADLEREAECETCRATELHEEEQAARGLDINPPQVLPPVPVPAASLDELRAALAEVDRTLNEQQAPDVDAAFAALKRLRQAARDLTG